MAGKDGEDEAAATESSGSDMVSTKSAWEVNVKRMVLVPGRKGAKNHK